MAWGNKSNDAATRVGGGMSFIGNEVTITGNLTAKGDIQLDGDVR